LRSSWRRCVWSIVASSSSSSWNGMVDEIGKD
jgi:hypothetical protein